MQTRPVPNFEIVLIHVNVAEWIFAKHENSSLKFVITTVPAALYTLRVCNPYHLAD